MRARHSPGRLTCLLAATTLWISAGCVHRPAKSDPPGATPSRTASQPHPDDGIQARVLDLADEHIAALGEAVYLTADAVREDPKGRRLVQSFLRNGVGATLDIAVGPNPNIALLDLLVLASLQSWAFENHWIPAGIDPEIGRRAVERLKVAEEHLWHGAKTALSPGQLDTLRGLIDDWIQANPDRTVVAFVRFEEFTDRRRSPASLHQRADTLLGQIRAMAGVVDDSRALAEKLIWYAGRFPYVLGEQAELTAYRLADQPEVRRLAEGSDALTRAADAVAMRLNALMTDLESTREQLILDLRAERTEGIDQLFQRLAAERHATLDDLESRREQLAGLLAGLRDTVDAATGLAVRLTETAGAVDRITGRFADTPESGGEALDLKDVRDAAIEATRMAERWTTLLERIDATLLAPEETGPRSKAVALSEGLVDRIFWRTLILLVVGLAGLAGLRRLPRARP